MPPMRDEMAGALPMSPSLSLFLGVLAIVIVWAVITEPWRRK